MEYDKKRSAVLVLLVTVLTILFIPLFSGELPTVSLINETDVATSHDLGGIPTIRLSTDSLNSVNYSMYADYWDLLDTPLDITNLNNVIIQNLTIMNTLYANFVNKSGMDIDVTNTAPAVLRSGVDIYAYNTGSYAQTRGLNVIANSTGGGYSSAVGGYFRGEGNGNSYGIYADVDDPTTNIAIYSNGKIYSQYQIYAHGNITSERDLIAWDNVYVGDDARITGNEYLSGDLNMDYNNDINLGSLSPISASFDPSILVQANTNLIGGLDFKNTNNAGWVRFITRDNNNNYMFMGQAGTSVAGTFLGVNRATNGYLMQTGTEGLAVGTNGNSNLTLGTNDNARLSIQGNGFANYNGDFKVNGYLIGAGTGGGFPSVSSGYVVLYAYDNAGTPTGRVLPYDGSSYIDLAIGDWNGGNPNIMLKTGGKVGIGVGLPTTQLEVAGVVNATGYAINNSGMGYTGTCVNVTYVGGLALSCND